MESAVKTIGFGPEALWITLGTLTAIAALVLLGLQIAARIREIREPGITGNREMEKQMREEHGRLCTLEQSTSRQEEELKMILRAQIVMMHHIVDGNGVENLKAMQRQIEEYLVYGRRPDDNHA